jgi:S-methylmethionine-dependent homocysteine/selenocysteine methylase
VHDSAGSTLLSRYYAEFVDVAVAAGTGVLLETATWRASSNWGGILGYDAAALDRTNRAAVALVRAELDAAGAPPNLVSGCVGPLGDGYLAGGVDADQAAEYHAAQVTSLAEAGADLVHAMTMTGPAEAMGVVRAARAVNVPVAVSFTVETNGCLPDGSKLGDAITAMETAAPADYYGLNCAHPTHVQAGLDGGAWQERVTFFRPNASTLSHAELDAMEELDAGNMPYLVSCTRKLREQLPAVTVLGGCCGTDSGHVAALWGVGSAQ